MSGYTTALAIVDDGDDLIALTAAVGTGYATPDGFEHWFLGHPLGETRVPVVRDGAGRIVGSCWIFPYEVVSRGESYRLFHVGNLMVHPEHRGTFAYALLARHVNRLAAELAPAHVSVVSPSTFDRHRASWPERVRALPWATRLLDPDGWARDYARARGKSWLLGPATWLARLAAPSLSGSPDPRMQWGQDAFVQLGRTYSEKASTVHPKATPAFLRWRFGPETGRDYRHLSLGESAGSRAEAVIRLDAPVGERTAYLCHVDGENTRAVAGVLGEAMRAAFEAGATTLSALLPTSTEMLAAFREVGLRGNPGHAARRFEGLWPPPVPLSVVVHEEGAVSSEVRTADRWEPTLTVHELI